MRVARAAAISGTASPGQSGQSLPGGPKMRTQRRILRASWLTAAAFILLPPFTRTTMAQPGFGPDPFWPYNSQYAPYVSPMGPAGPGAGQGEAYLPRSGLRGANQFQQYLDDMTTEGRSTSDRANIGMPYYRSSVNPNWDPRSRGSRQYRPNSTPLRTLQQVERTVADKFLTLYAEPDPVRREEMLRDYRTDGRVARSTASARGSTASSVLEASERYDALLSGGSGSDTEGRRPARGSRSSSGSNRAGLPAPEVPTVPSSRSRGSSSRGTTPSDVLRRSQARDDTTSSLLPGSPSLSLPMRRTNPGRSRSSSTTRSSASRGTTPRPNQTP